MRHKDEHKNESIFNAAIQLINELGLAETSMSKIAKKANVSASTIYVYFENKEDLINKLYLSIKKQMSLEIFHNFDDSTPLQTAFETILRKFVDFILNNKDYFLFIEQFGNSPLLHKLSRKEATELFEPIYSLFEKGKKQGVFKQVDTNLLVIFTFNPVMQFAKEHFNGKSELNQDNLKEIIQMSWDAVKA
ncbi:AcrR family transcriptional regulator [Collibacillus ludicampi]|uniref:AcrR family transcriptional regulator n=1 Tax=Collibacillus ludicampi TaxID=2771369 RepID=A0AAV4LBL0_9BACL|nr:TetR/AcrR family transcriptional regulator [Collibacillus ludicampi]GIM45186.1 AcrR family transcriptional regulator [Collibacillus ludicampi]